MIDVKITNIQDLTFTKWSGGTTTQLFIQPEGFKVSDDFDIRISSATIRPGDSVFTNFKDYNRFLTILEGWIDISHPNNDGEKEGLTRLEKNSPYYFDGAIKTVSKSEVEVRDFNVIWKKSISDVKVEILNLKELTKKEVESGECFLFALDEISSIELNEKDYLVTKGDFIQITEGKVKMSLKGNFIFIKI
ncbi:MAG: HutD family protein [Fusobacteriaceae bacterium]